MSPTITNMTFLFLKRQAAIASRYNRYPEWRIMRHQSPQCGYRVGGVLHRFSTESIDSKSISECASHLSKMIHGDRALSQALARHLSPEARNEVVAASQRLPVSEKGNQPPSEGASEAIPVPTRRDLILVAVNQLIPFIGFGLMDNALLIVAGDAIDTSLGVAFGISTLCAAAIGNIISDVAGVGLGTVIEDISAKLNIPQPNLTQLQRKLRSVRFASQFGCAVGITIGCIIGMFPLLFIDTKKTEKMKQVRSFVFSFRYVWIDVDCQDSDVFWEAFSTEISHLTYRQFQVTCSCLSLPRYTSPYYHQIFFLLTYLTQHYIGGAP